MANLDELEDLEVTRRAEVSERVRRFRELHSNRRALPPAQTELAVVANPDLDRAAEALNKEAEEGAKRLAATINGALAEDEGGEQIAEVAAPQPVVDTAFKVRFGRVYVYDRLPDGSSVQRDVTSNYYRGTGGRITEDASKRDRWNRLPPIMQPVVMRPAGATTQTTHDAHCGAVCD